MTPGDDTSFDDDMDMVAVAAMELARKGKGQTHAEITRQYVEMALARLTNGEALNETLVCTVMCILSDILEGYDPRLELDIAPKSGRRKSVNNSWIAAHYWSLREVEPLEKRAASEVASAWGISPGRVRKIAIDRKSFALKLCTVLTLDRLAGLSRLMAEDN